MTENFLETSENSTASSAGDFSIKFLGLVFVIVPICIFLMSQKNKAPTEPASAQSANFADKVYPNTPAGAIERLVDAVNVAPSATNLTNLGMAYFENNQFQESVDASLKALEMNDKQPVVFNNICAAYNRLDDFFKAKIYCNKALKLSPGFALAKNNLLEAEVREKRINQLISEEKGSSPSASGMLELGLYYHNQKKLERAVEVFIKGIKTDSKNVLLLTNACAVQCELRHWGEAIDLCKQALRIDGNSALAQGNLKWAQDGLAGLL